MRPKGLHASRRLVLPCPPDKQLRVLHRNGRKRLGRASLRCGCRHPAFWCGGQLGSQLPPLRLKQGLPIAPPPVGTPVRWWETIRQTTLRREGQEAFPAHEMSATLQSEGRE